MAFQVKIHQIRAFVEVARQGSIRGASRMLNMSQPALSKSIQELEEGLAAQLFFRRSKGVTLTDAGESFYQHASLILEELRAAQEDIRQRQGQLAGQINIGMGASISRSLMPAVISRFHQQHPQVKVRIMEGQLVSMINELRQGELDFTINTYYQDPTTTNLLLRNYWKSNSRSFAARDIPPLVPVRSNSYWTTAGQCRRHTAATTNS
ncbi:putative DNA-binding transcriptional regulator of abgABT operon [Escherichia coli]|uniref:Putative DNA-binding transcriptional regulator of abgABT operon n=1 Tax=Escherichia coli TaxID=562 RepID=A0A376LQ68_ECOLX|nr:putative DNA-binding transcriptional regulator of abgABT operon [Escherichia coli]